MPITLPWSRPRLTIGDTHASPWPPDNAMTRCFLRRLLDAFSGYTAATHNRPSPCAKVRRGVLGKGDREPAVCCHPFKRRSLRGVHARNPWPVESCPRGPIPRRMCWGSRAGDQENPSGAPAGCESVRRRGRLSHASRPCVQGPGKRRPRMERPKRSHDVRLGMCPMAAAAAVDEEPWRPLRQLCRRSLLPARRDMDAPGQHPLILRMAIATSGFIAPEPPFVALKSRGRGRGQEGAGGPDGPSYAARLRACLQCTTSVRNGREVAAIG